MTFKEDNISCSGFRAGLGIERRQSLNRLDDDELELPGAVLLAMRRSGLVLGRVVAGDRALEARELDDDEAVELLRPLEDLELAAARQELAAEFPDDRRRQIGVLLVLLGVVDLRARDPIGDHLVLHSSLQVAAHSCCEVRNCLARTVRPMPNCFRVIGFRYNRLAQVAARRRAKDIGAVSKLSGRQRLAAGLPASGKFKSDQTLASRRGLVGEGSAPSAQR